MTPLKVERELTLSELGALFDSDQKQDFAVPASALTTRFVGEKNEGTEMRFTQDSNQHLVSAVPVSMTEYATKQFHGRLASGFTSYAEELRQKGMGMTYENNIRDLMLHDNRTFRVRTLLNDQHEERKVRAVVSDKFKPIDDDVVFGAALPLIDPERFQGIGGNKTDIRTVAKFVERNTSLTIQSGGRTREFHLGFILNNSEVGAGSASFSMFMTDNYCTNGCIFSKQVLANIAYRHVGSRIDIRHGLIEGSTVERAELASIRNLIVQATQAAMSMEGQDKIKYALAQSAERNITSDPVKFFDTLGKDVKLTKDEIKELPVQAYSDEMTQLGMQAAITALAQTKPYERRLELEQIGGNVLMMNDRKWNAINALAAA